jgi:hypothetical protein
MRPRRSAQQDTLARWRRASMGARRPAIPPALAGAARLPVMGAMNPSRGGTRSRVR